MKSDRQRLGEALAAVEARLSEEASTIDLQVERAGLLAALGRTELAKQRYLEILSQDPTHFATLNNFGVLLHETNFRTAARTLFNEAVTRHPNEALGHVNLANLLRYEDELDLARTHYEIALRLDPDSLHAHQQLSALFHDEGDLEAARHHRQLGFAEQPIQAYPYLGEGDPISLLVLTSTPGADLAWPNLVDAERFAVTTLVVEFRDANAPLPPHQLILNAIGDADLAPEDLLAAQVVVAQSGAAVINDPARVLTTGRMANAKRLGNLPNVVAAADRHLGTQSIRPRRCRRRHRSRGGHLPALAPQPGLPYRSPLRASRPASRFGRGCRRLAWPRTDGDAVSRRPRRGRLFP